MFTFMNQYPSDYPRHGFHICHGCGMMAPHHTQEDYPDNGWALPIDEFGYYAGFTDVISGLDPNQKSDRLRFCHDCVLKFLKMFPLLEMYITKGCHNQHGPNEKPCCKYSWKSESIGDSSIMYFSSEDANSWEIVI